MNSSRGMSLIELTFVMSILGGAFLAILSTMNFMAGGMHAETVYAEQNTRTTGTLYDVVSELRDATAYSPNFYLEVNPEKPPQIIFDKVDGVDSTGNMIWGSKITYRLEKVSTAASAQFEADHPGITQGRVIREEVFAQKNELPLVRVVEDNVPYRFTQNGTAAWGFNIAREGCALAITLSRFGDTGSVASDSKSSVNTQQQNVAQQNTNTLESTSTITLGSVVISTAKGVYFLKNPQVVIPAQ